MLTKDEIFSITDKALKEIEIPEWSGSIFIRGMTIEDVEYCTKLDSGDSQSLEKMIIRFVCDDAGIPIFTEEDIPAMQKKSIQAFRRIADEIRAFNSLDGAEKNSEGTPA